jgi:hypothetical protein
MSLISESPRTGSDRRRSERRPYIIEAWISSPTAKSAEDRLVATSVNISRHGVAFEIESELPIHAYHVIEIGYGDQRLVSEIRTVSCRKAPSGNFEVGAEFC